MRHIIYIFLVFISLSCKETATTAQNGEVENTKLKALIIDGDNNHGIWPKTTMMMKSYLEDTGLFEVTVYRGKYTYQGPHHGKVEGIDSITQLLEKYPLKNGQKTEVVKDHKPDLNFTPTWQEYDVVISNFGWEAFEWPEGTKRSFETYMKNGGGLVVIHAANNSYGDWVEYNRMIGLGGWGGRDLNTGFHMYYDDQGNLKREPSNGEESSHGPEVEFLITTRAPEHPVMKGLPEQWLHTKDELYDRLRGPAENVTILATAYSDVVENAQPWALENKGSGRAEPMLMTIEYGNGRVFHSAIGHMDYSMESVGFITTLQRGAEWAATGKVTQDIPKDFPDEKKSSGRSWILD